MNGDSLFPPAVFTIWWIGLIVTLVIFVPWAVYMLHRTWQAARSIQRHAAETLRAAAGILANTQSIGALDTTISAAGEMLAGAGAVVGKLGTVADVLADRAERGA